MTPIQMNGMLSLLLLTISALVVVPIAAEPWEEVGAHTRVTAALWTLLPGPPTAEEAALLLVEQDGSRVGTIYWTMLEENLVQALRKPYVSVGSDAGVMGGGRKKNTQLGHPRTFGTFARIFARYVREMNVLTIQEAVRRLTSLPAEKYGIRDRGTLKVGNFADIVIFDPAAIKDNATFERPNEPATGVRHVFVNGVQVLRNGDPTPARPGRFVKGRAAEDGGCRQSAQSWRWPQ